MLDDEETADPVGQGGEVGQERLGVEVVDVSARAHVKPEARRDEKGWKQRFGKTSGRSDGRTEESETIKQERLTKRICKN